MKRDRLLVGIVMLVLAVALAGAVFWLWTVRTEPPPTPRQAEVPEAQKAQGSSFAPDASPTQSVEHSLPERSAMDEVTLPLLPVKSQVPVVTATVSKRGNAVIEPAKQEGATPLPNESVSVTSVDAGNISVAISEFFRLFGAYPDGSNAAIAGALSGQNPKGIVLLSFKRIGKGGEMLDPWGHPYDIQITGNGRLQIRSAGSNRVMGDADDILMDHPLDSGKASAPAARPR